MTTFGFESGANNDTATTGNTGATTILATGGTLQISTTWAQAGTRSIKGIATSTSGVVYAQYTIGTATALYVEMYIDLSGTPSAETGFLFIGTGTTRQISLAMTTSRTIRVRDGANAAAYTSSAVVALSTPTKVCFFVTQNASTGTFRLAFGDTPFTSFDSDSTTLTAQNTGAAGYDSIRIGPKISTGTMAWDALFIDDFTYLTGGAGFPVAAPVISGPASQTPYVFFNLSATTVAVGPVAYTASPSTGVLGTSTGIYLPAPTDGSTLTYTVTATDTGNSATATTSVDVATPTGGVETVVWSGISWT
jgi:hypothetical protein